MFKLTYQCQSGTNSFYTTVVSKIVHKTTYQNVIGLTFGTFMTPLDIFVFTFCGQFGLGYIFPFNWNISLEIQYIIQPDVLNSHQFLVYY